MMEGRGNWLLDPRMRGMGMDGEFLGVRQRGYCIGDSAYAARIFTED